MSKKRFFAILLSLALIFGMFANIPLSAAAPDERIEVLISGEYSGVSLFDYPQIYKFEDANHKEGLFSADTGWITECQWYDIEFFGFGLYIVYGEQGCGLIDATGTQVVPATWDSIYLTDGGVIAAYANGLWGLLDIQGNVIFEPCFEYISNFYDGIAKVYINENVGFINTTGRYISQPFWTDAQDFSDSLAAVMNDDGLWGYIDNEGKLVIACQYENVSSFNNGYASILEDDTVYIIDKNGNKIIRNGRNVALEPTFDCMGYVESVIFGGSQNDVGCVKFKGEEKHCYIDNNYYALTENIYKYNVIFTERDYAITVMPNRFGMEKYALLSIDRTSSINITTLLNEKNYITEVEFNYGQYIFFDADNRLYNLDGVDLFGMEFEKYIYHNDFSDIINAVYKGQYVCVDFNGNVISTLSDYQFYYVNENLYMATADDGRVKFCDRSGKQISYTAEYAEAYYENGIFFVKNDDGKWGVCDTDCSVIVEPQFDVVYSVSDGMLKFKNNGKYGFVNMKTLEIIKEKFTSVSEFNEGLCWVSEKALVGAIDKLGNYIIDPLYWGYNDCTGFGSNNFSCGVTALKKHKSGNYGVVNKKGEKILDFTYSYIGDFDSFGVAVFEDYNNDGSCNRGLMKIISNESTVTPTKITTDKNEILTYVGCYDVITEVVTPDTSADLGVTFVSQNEAVATVDSVGRVYGVSEGNAFILVVSKANISVMAAINVKVLDRTLHNANDIIPDYAWEEQYWLADVVLDRLSELGIEKTVEQLTFGDLTEVIEINITEFEDTDCDAVYHIPSLIGEFSNLITINIHPNTFMPLISTLPDSTKFLSNLASVNISNTYGESVNEDIIRNNEKGIPDENLYSSIGTPVYKSSFANNLQYKGIKDITGLSLLNNFYYSLDLSYNYITDISELGNMNLKNLIINLSYNMLDLTDESTIAVIEKLKANGCSVYTEGQNKAAVKFVNPDAFMYPEYYSSVFTEPNSFYLTVGYTMNKSQPFIVHPYDKIDDIFITTSNSNVAKAYIEDTKDGMYNLNCKGVGLGKATLFVMRKSDGAILYEIPVKVSDSRFFVEDIEVSYYISEWSPTYAQLQCYNDWYALQYRKVGESEWQKRSCIYENGTYEIRYCTLSGMYSNIATLEITGIKQKLTETQMPDQNLRNQLNGGNGVYEGYQVNYFYASFQAISDLTGLSLLDFSNCDSWIYLNDNNITNISELAKLGLKNTTIDLSSNKIDFTLPENAKALRELYKNGCTVNMKDQSIEDFFVKTRNFTLSTQLGINWSSSIRVSPVSEIDNIALVLEETDVITNFSYYVNENYIYYSYTTSAYGAATVNVLYKGEFLKSFTLTFIPQQSQQAISEPTIRVSSFREEMGFEVYYENGGQYYEYRKLGDSEWTLSNSSWIYITSAGTYEFRYKDYNGNISEIATVKLKTAEYNGLNLVLDQGGWNVQSVDSTKIGENLIIPETIDGYPVCDITSGIIYFHNLKSISIPKTVKSVGSLTGCPNLTSVTISKDNPYYYTINGFVVTKDTDSVVWYPIPEDGILEVPNGVKSFNSHIFNNKITSIYLPESVESVSRLFSHTALNNIIVDKNNPHYYVSDGFLYEKYTGTLVAYPTAKTGTITISERVLFIGDNTFTNSKHTNVILPSTLISINYAAFEHSLIQSVEVPFGLVSINSYAFYGTSSLKKLFVPSSVTKIGYSAFDRNTTIYCIENSTAHNYAVNNNYNYVLVTAGDCNYDGSITASDIIEFKKFLLTSGDMSMVEQYVYDLNSDGNINVLDYISIQKNLIDPQTNSVTENIDITVQPAYLKEEPVLC